ncbi:STAS domain-containing protein [Achromobacter xylosoxidans]|uniref:STAS domain-containing protein n=1 Tax=Alcaligenes xylosoxydans xylosoxydans TaxID=85698 RepID=UPI002795D672|nr:STAS domain-containing protein [Achromobacter xylosoxidans]
MNLFVEHIDDALVVCPKGQLNSANAAEFEADILARLATGAARLILDLSGLDYISSAGLRVVLVAAQTVRGQGGCPDSVWPERRGTRGVRGQRLPGHPADTRGQDLRIERQGAGARRAGWLICSR